MVFIVLKFLVASLLVSGCLGMGIFCINFGKTLWKEDRIDTSCLEKVAFSFGLILLGLFMVKNYWWL